MAQEQSFEAIFQQNLQKMAHLSAKQRQILEVALKLFATQGFEATTTAQIAQAAGVAEGTVYRQFPNKQALLLAVMSPIFASAETAADEFTAEVFSEQFDSLESLVTSIIGDRMAYLDQNFLMVKLLLGQLLTNSAVIEPLKAVIGKRISQYAVPEIKRLQAENKIVKLPVDVILQLAMGPVAAYLLRKSLDIGPLDTGAQVAAITQFIIQGLSPKGEKE